MKNIVFKNTELYNKINSSSKYKKLQYEDIVENELYFLLHSDYDSLINEGFLEQEKLFNELSQIISEGNGKMTVQLNTIKELFESIQIENILFIDKEETYVRLLKEDILEKSLEKMVNDIYYVHIYPYSKNPDYKRLTSKIFSDINILLPLMFLFRPIYRDTIITLLSNNGSTKYDYMPLLIFCIRNANISETILITSLIEKRDLTFVKPELLFKDRPSIEEFAKFYSTDIENHILYTDRLAYALSVLGPDYINVYFKNEKSDISKFIEVLNKVRKIYSTKHKTPYLTEDFIIFADKSMNIFFPSDGEINIFKYYYNFSKEKLSFYAFDLDELEIVLNESSLLTNMTQSELLYLIPVLSHEEKKLLLDKVLSINLNSYHFYGDLYEEKVKKRYIYSRLLEFLFKFGDKEIRDIITTESFNIIESTKLSEKDKNQIMVDLFENLTYEFTMTTCELTKTDIKKEYGNLDW